MQAPARRPSPPPRSRWPRLPWPNSGPSTERGRAPDAPARMEPRHASDSADSLPSRRARVPTRRGCEHGRDGGCGCASRAVTAGPPRPRAAGPSRRADGRSPGHRTRGGQTIGRLSRPPAAHPGHATAAAPTGRSLRACREIGREGHRRPAHASRPGRPRAPAIGSPFPDRSQENDRCRYRRGRRSAACPDAVRENAPPRVRSAMHAGRSGDRTLHPRRRAPGEPDGPDSAGSRPSARPWSGCPSANVYRPAWPE
jgi:hypothetical protein